MYLHTLCLVSVCILCVFGFEPAPLYRLRVSRGAMIVLALVLLALSAFSFRLFGRIAVYPAGAATLLIGTLLMLRDKVPVRTTVTLIFAGIAGAVLVRVLSSFYEPGLPVAVCALTAALTARERDAGRRTAIALLAPGVTDSALAVYDFLAFGVFEGTFGSVLSFGSACLGALMTVLLLPALSALFGRRTVSEEIS